MNALDQFDAFGYGGVGGNAIQVAQLVNPHPHGDADLIVQLGLRPAGIALNFSLKPAISKRTVQRAATQPPETGARM